MRRTRCCGNWKGRTSKKRLSDDRDYIQRDRFAYASRFLLFYKYMPITFEDFKKVEIRIGKIIAAEKISEGDKLLKLSVDFGTETRQIMSGIAEFFPDPSVLVGRQAPFVTNLAPRTLRGYESHGMILATDGEKGIVLLHPAEEVLNGNLVK